MTIAKLFLVTGALLVSLPAFAQNQPVVVGKEGKEEKMAPVARPAAPDRDMKLVLDAMTALGGKPIETLSAAEARKQPTAADAVQAVQKNKTGKDPQPEAVGQVEDRQIDGPAGNKIPIRIYTPKGKGPFPVVVYYHGGGWVIADLDTYDASARALTNVAGAIVISAHYRQGPEARFPAAHEDAFAAYKWTLENASSLGGDPGKIAVAGESAGGNLAMNVAIRARDEKRQQPVHMLLVYPVAGKDMTTQSYIDNADARPLSRAAMEWFVANAFADKLKVDDPRIDLVGRTDLAGLPSATIITAEIDPLRSEGQMLAQKLKEQGVKVDHADYRGVAHEFFGMAAVLPKARQAQQRAGKNLKAAFKAAPRAKDVPLPAKAPEPRVPDIAKEPGAPTPEPKGPAAPTAPPSKL